MSQRRFANFGIEALEKLFDESRSSKDVLQSIGAELFHRKTSRAAKLLARVSKLSLFAGKQATVTMPTSLGQVMNAAFQIPKGHVLQIRQLP